MRTLSTTLVLACAMAFVSTAVLAIPGGGRQNPSPSPIAGSASISHAMPATVTTSATSSECQNNPGPFIRLDGTISLGGLSARLRFSNNARGTHQHEEDIVTSVDLVSDDPIVFSKQPSQGGVGGNPWIYLQLADCASGEGLDEPILLGRCVQGLAMVSTDTLADTVARLRLTSGSCQNNPGPWVRLEGELSLGGVCATIIFTNNAQFTHVHEEDVAVEVVLIPAGQNIRFAKQPPLGGVGGNPHIYLQFTTGDGAPLGEELYLGRCNQLD